MADSVFTKIIRGEIPSHKIYQDDLTYAFLDIHPKTPGHTLVVPKKQVNEFQDLPDEDYAALWRAVKKIAERQKEIFPAKRIGVQIIGVDVPHAHVHVFPFSTMDEYRSKVDMNAEPDQNSLKSIAEKLAI